MQPAFNQQDLPPLTDAETKTVMKKLVKARTALVLEHPFIGSIALNMPYRLDETIPMAKRLGSVHDSS